MERFSCLTAKACPLPRENIDTDAIIPSREMTSVSKTGLADGLFAGWRYLVIGGREPDPTFVLNMPEFQDAAILVGGGNFGCGSSREHAVWALREYGFRAIIAPSFNPIFRGNCVRNGIVPVELPTDAVRVIAASVESAAANNLLTIDLVGQEVTTQNGHRYAFEIDGESKQMLVGGLDAISLTLQMADQISAFKQADMSRRPWVYL